MGERYLWSCWGIAAVLTLAAQAVDPLVVEGHELLGAPSTWVARTVGDAQVDPGPILRTGARCEPECRAVVAGQLSLPQGPGWVLQGEPELVRPGDRARLFVLVTGPDGEQRWFGSRRVHEVGGPRRALVPPEVAGWRADAGAILTGPDGELVVGPLSLRAARPSLLHAALWWGAVAAWGLLGVGAGAMGLARLRWAERLAMVAVVVVILVGIVLPRGALDDALTWVPGVDARDLGVPITKRITLPGLLQKGLGHAGGFAALGLTSALVGGATLQVLARVAAFAAATELMQLLTGTRSGSVLDLAIDAAGAGAGIGMAGLILARGAPRAR